MKSISNGSEPDAFLAAAWKPAEATLEDLPQLCELLGELFTQESDFKADRGKQMAGLQLLLDTPGAGRIFVLRHEGIAVGMISLLFTVSTCHGGFVLGLEDLIVHRDFRGRGAASALLEHAMGFARAIDAMRITLLTDPWNEPAIRLYLKHGFAASQMSVMRWHA